MTTSGSTPAVPARRPAAPAAAAPVSTPAPAAADDHLAPTAAPLAEAAVAVVRRSSLDPLRERIGAARLRLVWVLSVGAATVALLGVAPPREAGGLMVAAIGMLLVIRPVLLLCLGDPTLFDPDAEPSPATRPDDRA